MLTPNESALLRALLAREASAPADPAAAIAADFQDLAVGDVAQIRPFAERTFGGMLYQVCKATPYELRGFLLRPHRGGCREAWLPLKHCQLERIGRVWWPDPEFARRCEWKEPACRVQR